MINDFKFGRVVIIGDLLLDCYVSGSVHRISPEAPVPVLHRAHHTAVPGGAANVAMNAATLGSKVTLIGIVGQDSAADTLKNALSEISGIDLSHIVDDPNWITIAKTRVLSGRQQIVRIDEERIETPSAETRAQLIQAARTAMENADVVVCSDYAKGVLTDDVVQAVCLAARERGIPVIVDPKRKDLSAYEGAYLITPNRSELYMATGLSCKDDREITEAARVASAAFGGNVLVTRSEDGMTLYETNGKTTHVQVRKSEVYDVSGAGDTVVATIASILSAGQDLETAVVIASSAASIVVSKLGTATVSRAELSAALLLEIQEDGETADLARARDIIEGWRHHGARIAFTNGCFDLVHPGHIALIKAAGKQGDKLVVAINSDASVKRLKGEKRPLQDEQARATVIGALRDVDLVVIFDEDTPLETIKALRPDVIVKGADYRENEVVGGDFVKTYGGSVVLADLISGRSTTSIVRKMQVGV
ncbi:ADP-heptose synthase [Ameyamaea chiangmaiensis NBRC 103196]|uniref:Bifunctional protein HldE n=1 Tax=Ameyamaea chiangmaiensis TaxID=442969 RepID=A0A850P7S9_9PROT|nr:D-glycero-beta-D-manno-heptose-7-phosphate kinase [Ameyamaea chiangmaiensis]MBS4076411.1 D-glycero-beta-D-manno-heptose-7-phosphate kinase [Ameyamaea chiangmaiensis]NVN40657.1 D-glycero-beta-D-manno-heptose-7-phosphate kinase [Ameyamaea chiangmaiensis]GBQ63398.1 ADP-heptose synthase [Ameyamaea chiangmaiensis NBRC 103196]